MNRRERIERLLADYSARKASAQPISPPELLELYPELMPELSEALEQMEAPGIGARPDPVTDATPCPSPAEVRDWLCARLRSFAGAVIARHLEYCESCRV